MSQGDARRKQLIDLVRGLKCQVELPPSWKDFFDRSGRMLTSFDEQRRFPRSYLRTKAALEYRQSFPALARHSTWHGVYSASMSRGGMSFLHFEQLFPKEQMNLVLLDGKLRPIEVVRCRRVQERCFEIGAVFINGFRAPEPAGNDPG